MTFCTDCEALRNTLGLEASKRAERKLRAYQFMDEPKRVFEVARHIKISVRNTRRYLQEMVESGKVTITSRPGRNNKGTAYLYQAQ